jgi:predicted amidohydrolase YtcJ
VTGDGDELVRVGPVKVFADGGVEPAIEAKMGESTFSLGRLFENLDEQVEAIVARGFRVAVHALGNLGLEAALAAFDSAAKRHRDVDHRFRVEHACLASSDQLERLGALGGVAVVQPGFLDHLGGQVGRLEFENASWLPFGDVARSGATMAASSDCPCTFDEPLRTSAHGATRITSTGSVLDIGQAVDYEEWLRAYTAGAAYAGGQESERGSLAPGLRADLVVLEGRLDPHDPPAIHQVWVGGQIAHQISP